MIVFADLTYVTFVSDNYDDDDLSVGDIYLVMIVFF